MVKEDFKHELKQMFIRGLEEALVLGANQNSWKIREKADPKDIDKSEFFVLTISSQLFRIILVLHFSKDDATENYVANALKIAANNFDDTKFYDFLGEVGNTFCGSFKRDLGKIVPSLGMSTPNRLQKDCLQYINTLNTSYETHASAAYDDQPLFYASMYLSADSELEYNVSHAKTDTYTNTEDEVETGELELF